MGSRTGGGSLRAQRTTARAEEWSRWMLPLFFPRRLRFFFPRPPVLQRNLPLPSSLRQRSMTPPSSPLSLRPALLFFRSRRRRRRTQRHLPFPPKIFFMSTLLDRWWTQTPSGGSPLRESRRAGPPFPMRPRPLPSSVARHRFHRCRPPRGQYTGGGLLRECFPFTP